MSNLTSNNSQTYVFRSHPVGTISRGFFENVLKQIQICNFYSVCVCVCFTNNGGGSGGRWERGER